jgi:TonB-linked SusC/RagA family outer membrane protein
MIKLISGKLQLRLMKFILFQFVILYGVLANTSSGQTKISLSEMKLEIEGRYSVDEIFKMIENQSELSFSYHKKDISSSLTEVMEFTSGGNSIYNILLIISENEKLRFKRINNIINVLKDKTLTIPVVEEESYPIQGRVLDESGEGMPGATVIIKGTALGTITDVNGDFSIDLPDEAEILVVTFVGYEPQEIKIDKSKTSMVIQMKLDLESLDEVVVVGYGQQKKESITGSVARMDNRELTQTKTANIANNLAGRLPGLVINARGGQPGQENMEIYIRGKGTFGNAQPLYVIDGVANRGTFERLNPEDIESISVLKDASAAIYGAQAANGVILITTKRGENGKPTLKYSNSFALTQPARRQQLMDAVQYLTWIDEQNIRNSRPQIFQNVIKDYRDGENDPEVWGDTDWWEESMDEWSPQFQHNLSLSGGNDAVKYFVSGQHLYQDAIYKGHEFDFSQSNLRSNIDIQATSFLNVGLDLAGRLEHRTGRKDQGATESAIRGVYAMAPFESPYYTNGLLRKTSKGNPIPLLNGQAGGADYTTLTLNNKLSFDLSLNESIKGLSIIGFAAFDFRNIEKREIGKPYDIYFLNSDSEYDNLKDETGKISLFQQFDEELSKTYHARLNYSRTFGKNSISTFVAYEQNQVEGEYIGASRRELVSEDLPFLFTGSESNLNNDGQGWQSARVNYFGRFNYQYDEKYLLEFTLRRDGSQNFPKNGRFGTFPGVSVGWRISEERFLDLDWVDELKIRGSFGILGNDRVEDINGQPASFQYLNLYNINEGHVLGEGAALSTGLTPSSVANPNITWETAQKTNLGFDLSMRNGLLDLVFDAFYEERSDILARRNASVPLYTGIELPNENIGKTINKGLEVSLLHRRKLGKDFNYRFGGQFTFTKNEIVFIDESPFVPSYQKLEGSPIDYLLVYQADGLYQNQEEIDGSPHFPDAKPGDVKFVDINKDGQITNDDRILLDEGPTPKVVFGFQLGATWKGFELNAFLQGQAGASTIYRPWDINQDSWYFENRWISESETPNAKSPAAWDMSSSTIQNVSTIWVKSNDFLRIKNVELAYNFPDDWINKIKISNLRFFVSGFNLGFIYDSVKLYDPESRSDTGWYYPQQRVITTGLSATF